MLDQTDGGKYYVKAINYDNYTIRVASADVQQDDCSSIPSMSFYSPYPFEKEIRFENSSVLQISVLIMFLSCRKPAVSPSYIDTAPCINSSSLFPENEGNNYSYVVYANGFKFSDLEESCQVYNSAFVSPPPKGKKKSTSYKDIHNELVYGFELSWVDAFAEEDTCPPCYVNETSNQVHCTSCSQPIDWFEETLTKIGYKIGDTCENTPATPRGNAYIFHN
ncbi:uncharacterized protein LOC21397188 [Morus notabilis]|uniref:uncharacterized protein LOC21397188 n=1 Tax=Morus notabilis TaxID=981085 RepID=UPI000CED5202|nr:uncharacterized protein LOC21397188 [Morus notabilis]